ncbi:MAG: (2Fe-2S) ferredoxin domain-containing protein, partial [Planctomycetes bacterium]|nr:(2Fe-2S) ferredoxin domain-containing protein [Planctomycetota bacterium]
MDEVRLKLLVCVGTGCVSNRSRLLRQALTEEVARRGLDREVRVLPSGCNGFCAQGPIVVCMPGGHFYRKVGPEDVPELVEEHVVQGRPVERLMYRPPAG